MERDALTPTKRCSNCGEHKPTTDFCKNRNYKDGLQYECRSCQARYYQNNKERYQKRIAKWRKANPDKYRAYVVKSVNKNPQLVKFYQKRSHAKRRGIEFSIKFEDIVWNDVCPILGVELDYTQYSRTKGGFYPNSASFDRIDPSKGYVKGNVIIVSARANLIKNNASVEELKKITAFYEQLVPPVGGMNVPNDN